MSFPFVIRTPDGTALRGEADFLVLPTPRGETGVLAEHAPMLASVSGGLLRIILAGRQSVVRVGPGLARVRDNAVEILAAAAQA